MLLRTGGQRKLMMTACTTLGGVGAHWCATEGSCGYASPLPSYAVSGTDAGHGAPPVCGATATRRPESRTTLSPGPTGTSASASPRATWYCISAMALCGCCAMSGPGCAYNGGAYNSSGDKGGALTMAGAVAGAGEEEDGAGVRVPGDVEVRAARHRARGGVRRLHRRGQPRHRLVRGGRAQVRDDVGGSEGWSVVCREQGGWVCVMGGCGSGLGRGLGVMVLRKEVWMPMLRSGTGHGKYGWTKWDICEKDEQPTEVQ
eukprot:108500-Rhodomonas_salina.3